MNEDSEQIGGMTANPDYVRDLQQKAEEIKRVELQKAHERLDQAEMEIRDKAAQIESLTRENKALDRSIHELSTETMTLRWVVKTLSGK